MQITRLLIANRGEIAVRIARAASDMNIRGVGVYSEDDALPLHIRRTDTACALNGVGPAAYLDAAQIIAVAKDAGCDAVHPGYGFLSENASFAADCAKAGLTFVGPSAEILELFGNKAAARAMAETCGVPVMRGTSRPTSLAEARAAARRGDEAEAEARLRKLIFKSRDSVLTTLIASPGGSVEF